MPPVAKNAESEVARRLAALSAREIVDALALGGPGARPAAHALRLAVALAARGPSARLGRHLARFDARIRDAGLAAAARHTLTTLGASVDVDGPRPSGPVLVVTNHPGAFDALALMSALDRPDTFLIAADRVFLRAMPHVANHLVFVSETSAIARAGVVRDAIDRWRRGSAVIHFGAGKIEPDTRFRFDDAMLLASWPLGTGALARAAVRHGASVVPAFVAGVHSPRAKRLRIVRWAERRGVTTVAPLVQATLPGFRDVEIAITFGRAIEADVILSATDDVARTEIVRASVARLIAPSDVRA